MAVSVKNKIQLMIMRNISPWEAHYNSAINFKRVNNFSKSIFHLERSLSIFPKNITAIIELAKVYMATGAFDKTEIFLLEVLKKMPKDISVIFQLADVLYEKKNYPSCKNCYLAALAIDKNNAVAYNRLGCIFFEEKKFPPAIKCFEKALGLDDQNIENYKNLARTKVAQKCYSDALILYGKALGLEPAQVEIYHEISRIYIQQKQYAEAETWLNKILEIQPFAAAWSDLGSIMHLQEKNEVSLACYRNAVALAPDDPEILLNLGSAYYALSDFANARVASQAALKIDPQHARAHWTIAILDLLHANFTDGWQRYEYRLKLEPESRYTALAPRWTGYEDVRGKRIVVYAEQGIGDFIQFSRYMELLADLGAVVYLETYEAMWNISHGLSGVSHIFTAEQAPPATDFQSPLMSLPLAFKTGSENIPASVPYLVADASLVKKWHAKLLAARRPRIGIVWAGNPQFGSDHLRSIPLVLFSTLFACPRVSYFSLQRDARAGDVDFLASEDFPVTDLRDDLVSMDETAAIISNLDLVISVDTAVAHLAGALGKKVWILLPHVPDFRWMLDSSSTPWYPTATLFRQSRPGDWNTLLQTVLMRLHDFADEMAPTDPLNNSERL